MSVLYQREPILVPIDVTHRGFSFGPKQANMNLNCVSILITLTEFAKSIEMLDFKGG